MRIWLAVNLLWFVASTASADAVLVVQRQGTDFVDDTTAGPNVAALLAGLGHDVTTAFSLTADPVLPADLSVFDTIWVIQTGGVPGVVQTRLVDYVNAGGGLVITGERSCCASINASVQNITNRLTTVTGTIVTADGRNVLTAVPGERYGVSTTPNAVPSFEVGEPGRTSGYPDANHIYRDADGNAIVLGFFGEELERGSGCLLVMMDLSVYLTDVLVAQDKSAFTENFQHFASTCGDTDGDGASDDGETRAGTGVADPDSDDDGLCDGYGRVEGVCIPGESIFANSDAEELRDRDSDGLIDPLDPDDDGDGIPTRDEIAGELAAPDADDDSAPAWLDVDSDGNNILDRFEGLADRDGDGIPGSVQLGDNPENCDSQADCDPFGEICDLDIGWCQIGGSVTDGGVSDGGASDGGRIDAGAFDGGASVDAGASGGPAADDGGCGCAVPGGSRRAPYALALLALLALGVRRRRRRR